MAKTKPTGVRFDEDLLNELKEEGLANGPQGALNFLEDYYRISKIMNSRRPAPQDENPPTPAKKANKAPNKPKEAKVEETLAEEVETAGKGQANEDMAPHNKNIVDQIAAIRQEPIPAHRNTVLGRKSWETEQQARIAALQLQLRSYKG